MIILTERLQAVAGMVIPGKVCADIGTDHAYLPVYLIENRIIPSVIATDRSKRSLAAARHTVSAYGLEGKIEIRAGDGLSVISPGEAGTVCLAGMGGSLMLAILKKSRTVLDKTQRLVVQPQRDINKVRRHLADSGWRIIEEKIVKDGGIWYQIMAFEKGQMDLSEAEAQYGPSLLRRGDPLLREFLEEKYQANSVLIKKLAQNSGARLEQRIKQLIEDQETLADFIAELEANLKKQP